jgi:hypothetical protein
MLAISSAHTSRLAAFTAAGRLLVCAGLALAILITVVFAHGGACAAVELAEQAAHEVGTAHIEPTAASPASHDETCLHRGLPAGHQHGTEPDCSAALGPASGPSPVIASMALHPALAQCVKEPSTSSMDTTPPISAEQENLCVLRI